VLTLAYCRVSTEEQAAEGYSIEGQADRLRAYSAARDLGEVVVINDPGLSGKDMRRPGLQQLLAAVEAGHVAHVLIWRLDRLSRNLGDLILLADTLGDHGVALHSISENLDLSSAAGRMFYNILGRSLSSSENSSARTYRWATSVRFGRVRGSIARRRAIALRTAS
jgi:DNA invertase Pin-like site-specific DNA recombinase